MDFHMDELTNQKERLVEAAEKNWSDASVAFR